MDKSESKKEEWNWARHKPNNCLSVKTTPEKDFFKWWCVFQCPFVSLTNREVDIISAFLKERFELTKVVSDPDIIDSILMSTKTIDKIIASCGITKSNFYVVMGTLKKKKVITNGGINPKLIPNIRKDDNGCFQLLVLFRDVC